MRKTLGILNIVSIVTISLGLIRSFVLLQPGFDFPWGGEQWLRNIAGIILLGGATSIAGLFLLEGKRRKVAFANLVLTGILFLELLIIVVLGSR